MPHRTALWLESLQDRGSRRHLGLRLRSLRRYVSFVTSYLASPYERCAAARIKRGFRERLCRGLGRLLPALPDPAPHNHHGGHVSTHRHVVGLRHVGRCNLWLGRRRQADGRLAAARNPGQQDAARCTGWRSVIRKTFRWPCRNSRRKKRKNTGPLKRSLNNMKHKSPPLVIVERRL